MAFGRGHHAMVKYKFMTTMTDLLITKRRKVSRIKVYLEIWDKSQRYDQHTRT